MANGDSSGVYDWGSPSDYTDPSGVYDWGSPSDYTPYTYSDSTPSSYYSSYDFDFSSGYASYSPGRSADDYSYMPYSSPTGQSPISSPMGQSSRNPFSESVYDPFEDLPSTLLSDTDTDIMGVIPSILGSTVTGTSSGGEPITEQQRLINELLELAVEDRKKKQDQHWYDDPMLRIFALQFGLGILGTERQTAAQKKENEKDREFQRQESAAAHERTLEQIQAQADAEGGEAGSTSAAFNLFTRRPYA